MLTTLRKLFTLKPYGNNLLNGVTETWLILAVLNILAIAFCDAVAWSYFGWTTATGNAAWAAAAIAGLVVFLLVGSVDAMFVMHDRSRRTGESKVSEESRSRFALRRDHFAVLARVILVVLTFTVTAPFLTQMFFAQDIEANIARRNEQTVGAKRRDMNLELDQRLTAIRSQLSARQRDLEKEIAGAGSSGRYGRGPTADAIGTEIRSLQSQLAATEREKVTELAAFDAAIGTPELLASRYGIDLVRQGPDTRARVIEELEKSPSFRSTRLNIKAFLLFMFLGLLCLKLFQPDSVRIYYSARLQAAYSRMKAGVFDNRLDPRERSAGVMDPVRFADWYENDQHVRDETERLRDQTNSAIERLRTQEDALHALGETLRSDISRMHTDLSETSKSTEELEQDVLAKRQELSALNVKILEEQQALEDFSYDLAEDLPLRDQQMLMSTRSTTVRRLAEHRSAAAGLTATLTRLEQRLSTARTYETQLRESLAEAGTESTTLARALQQARQRRASDIIVLS